LEQLNGVLDRMRSWCRLTAPPSLSMPPGLPAAAVLPVMAVEVTVSAAVL